MKITKVLLSKLKPAEKNVRIHSAKQIEEFKRSVEMFGQIRPIVCDEAYTIIAGNGLYAALTALGRTEADCYVIEGLSEIQKKKLMLADNRIFSLGADDIQAFDEIILELDNDFDIPGYDASLLETLTISVDDADDYIFGYGIISDERKEQMHQAERKYQKEETQFSEAYEEYTPYSAPEDADNDSQSPQSADNIGASSDIDEQGESVIELQHRYIICHKCGEKIWL